MTTKKPLVVFVVGPTATGKSQVALQAARAWGGTIVNADSVQVYRSVDIGTAKPSPSDFASAKHVLFSFVEEGRTYTAGEYRRDALFEIVEANPSCPVFFVVGGSGFYIRALEKGMYEAPEVRPETRARVDADEQKQGLPKLFEELRMRDPKTAENISANDRYRIRRALEINREIQGEQPDSKQGTWSDLRESFAASNQESPFQAVKLGITRDRNELRHIVRERTQNMLKLGLIEEVKELMGRGLQNWAPMQSVGYRETQAYLAGAINKDVLLESIVTSTMQLAKRQMTWFRGDESVRWWSLDGWTARSDRPLIDARPELWTYLQSVIEDSEKS